MQSVPGDIIECNCGLRYMRTQSPVTTHEQGHFNCACGQHLGAWSGLYRVMYEPEDGVGELN